MINKNENRTSTAHGEYEDPVIKASPFFIDTIALIINRIKTPKTKIDIKSIEKSPLNLSIFPLS